MAVLMHNGIHFNHLLSFVKVTRPDFYKVLPFLSDAYTAYFVFHLSPFTIFGFSKFSLTKDEELIKLIVILDVNVQVKWQASI